MESEDVSDIVVELNSGVGLVTLNRPKALNALTLDMIRELTTVLLAWRGDASVKAVAIRGEGRQGPFGAFCAGGDIRFFHQAALAGDPRLEDFFTEEYSLDHLVHGFGKPLIAFMDGVVMGGGMGIAQGASLRIATERTKMAMPETNIGLFPDVGGGFFLGRCPGRIGEYLALTGHVISGADAVAVGLADVVVDSAQLAPLWAEVAGGGVPMLSRLQPVEAASTNTLVSHRAAIDRCFALPTVMDIMAALEADASPWAAETAAVLRKRSPLMLHVVLEQVRRGRESSLADDLRMERNLVRNCFHLRPGAASETVEGIRALAVDKDHRPRWNPARIEDVTPDMVAAFFEPPWPPHAHPLRHLG
ncbi:MAG: enoyl-CoA hydratase/isomerase family protein [Ramlibacter sp.]|jgi:enoyl-CoA hydratase/carnithine racemase|nr:enoyl-CoA hydratase/isomerase family protein [Ramlibacter sp.]